MSTKEILQNNLDQLYLKYLDKILTNEIVTKSLFNQTLSSPYFINVNIAKYANNDWDTAKRILIVGKETMGWADDSAKNTLNTNTNEGNFTNESKIMYLHHLKELYRKFEFGNRIDINQIYHSPFWDFIKDELITRLTSIFPNSNFICTNLSRHAENEAGITNQELYKIVHFENNFILREEIKIIKPEIIIFLTGPYRDNLLRQTFSDLNFTGINGWNFYKNGNSFISRLQSQQLPFHSYRTYHPQSYTRQKRKLGGNPYALVADGLINLIQNQ